MTSIQVQRGNQVTQSGALFVKISFLGSTPLVFINPSTNSEWEPVRQCSGLPLRPLSQCLPSRTLPAKCGLNGKKANLELAAWKTKQQQVQVNTFCWKNFRLYSTTGALSCSSRSPSPSPPPSLPPHRYAFAFAFATRLSLPSLAVGASFGELLLQRLFRCKVRDYFKEAS